MATVPTESHEYKYENSWKDQLTSIVKSLNGVVVSTKIISYTGSIFIGNPSSIGDKNLTWSGRRLTKITETNKDTIEYFYNEEAVRTKKKVGTDITTYELNGSNIISETTNGTETIKYIYNERGLLVGFEHLSKVYYYVRNLLGIITEIVDENGYVMVSYKYDAWGKLLDKVFIPDTIGEDIALLNHFVYKGYYLDNDTEWYYLKSRYYNSTFGKFVNSDNLIFIDSEDTLDMNVFAYCSNNPVMDYDLSGNFGFFKAIKKGWKKVKKSVSKILNTVKTTLRDVSNITKKTVNNAWDLTKNTADAVWSWTKETANDIWSWVVNTSSTVWSWVKNTATGVWNCAKNAAITAWDWTKNATTTAWNWITDIDNLLWLLGGGATAVGAVLQS